MADATPTTIPIPPDGFDGIEALIELGEERLAKLANAQTREALDLSLSLIFDRLATFLECDESTLSAAVLSALVPLNGLRRATELSHSEFMHALDYTISIRAPENWREEYLESWKQILPALGPFFEPDNFFAQTSKAFDLLSERPAVFLNARILTELRPIFAEDATKSVAVLHTNTLVLDYRDGQRRASLHVTLDSSDLDAIESEIVRARKKLEVSRNEAGEQGVNLVSYGESTSS